MRRWMGSSGSFGRQYFSTETGREPRSATEQSCFCLGLDPSLFVNFVMVRSPPQFVMARLVRATCSGTRVGVQLLTCMRACPDTPIHNASCNDRNDCPTQTNTALLAKRLSHRRCVPPRGAGPGAITPNRPRLSVTLRGSRSSSVLKYAACPPRRPHQKPTQGAAP